jgi:hypothetical protein
MKPQYHILPSWYAPKKIKYNHCRRRGKSCERILRETKNKIPSQHPMHFVKKWTTLPTCYSSKPYKEFILKRQSKMSIETRASTKIQPRPLMHFLGPEPQSGWKTFLFIQPLEKCVAVSLQKQTNTTLKTNGHGQLRRSKNKKEKKNS